MFQHHIQVPAAGHAVAARRGDAYFCQNGVHPALGNENMVCHDGLVVLPPATQGKGLGGLMAVHIKCDGKICADLRLHSQQFQHMGVCGRLVGALLRKASLHRVAVAPVGLVGIGVTDLHMGFVEGHLCGHAHEPAKAPGLDERIVLQLLELLLGEVLEGAMGPAPGLTEVVLLDALVDGEGDGKERGEEHRCQGDGQHRHQIAGAAGQKGTADSDGGCSRGWRRS